MKLTALFARRYLFSRNSRSVINIIAGVSIAAIAVPVAAMIILLSVFNGFEGLIRQMRSEFDADLAVMPARGGTFALAELPKERMTAVEGVAAASYTVEQGAMAEYGANRRVVEVRGVDDDYARVLPVEETLLTGTFDIRTGDIDRAVPGRGVAYALGIHSFVTDDLRLYALRRKSFSTLLPVDGWTSVALPVGAVFATDAETDGKKVLTSLRAAQHLFDYPDRATALLVRLDEGASEARVARHLRAAAGEGFRVTTRDEANASLYRIMRYEKWSIFVIALLVLLIASLSVVGVLAMLIIEKRRDIATLRALGADRRLLRSIFRAEGLLLSSLGGAGGAAAGIALCLAQQHFGLITIPAETLLVTVYPVELRMTDVAATTAAFFAVAWGISAATVNSMIKKQTLLP